METNPLVTFRTRTIAGREFRIYKLTIEDFLELEDWVNRQFPDPFEVAEQAIQSERFNVAQQQLILKEAMQLACKGRRKLGTPEADEKASSIDGTCELLFLSILKGHPNLTRDQKDSLRAEIQSLRGQLTPKDILVILNDTDATKVIDPKAPTPPATMTEELQAAEATATGPASGPSSIS